MCKYLKIKHDEEQEVKLNSKVCLLKIQDCFKTWTVRTFLERENMLQQIILKVRHFGQRGHLGKYFVGKCGDFWCIRLESGQRWKERTFFYKWGNFWLIYLVKKKRKLKVFGVFACRPSCEKKLFFSVWWSSCTEKVNDLDRK